MIISKTPLRISFVGGGSDLSSFFKVAPGKVLSASIDKYIYVIIKERFDKKIVLNYSNRESVNNVNEIKHDLIRETLKKTSSKWEGIEITTLADIPSEGSGLGSSSTVTVGLLHSLYRCTGKLVSKEQLAEEACEIEISNLRRPIGKQDQYACAFGGINVFQFNSDESVIVDPLNRSDEEIRKFGSNLLLFYTNKTRKSSTILEEQKNNTINKIHEIQKMVDLVNPFRKHIISKDYDALGELLDKNWRYKMKLSSGISTSKIEKMYNLAICAGAIGGKISGAGGGGFLLLYVQRHKQDRVRSAMKQYRELPFMIDKFGSRIIFDQRT